MSVIAGYRAWNVEPKLAWKLPEAFSDHNLTSLFFAGFVWHGGVNHASCVCVKRYYSIAHAAVHAETDKIAGPASEGHSCGFHAYDGVPLSSTSVTRAGAQRVLGVIVGWGRVSQHSLGFRTEFAQIVCFASTEDPALNTFLRQYAPAVPRASLAERLGEFGVSPREWVA